MFIIVTRFIRMIICSITWTWFVINFWNIINFYIILAPFTPRLANLTLVVFLFTYIVIILACTFIINYLRVHIVSTLLTYIIESRYTWKASRNALTITLLYFYINLILRQISYKFKLLYSLNELLIINLL